jgi:hypothetical protein
MATNTNFMKNNTRKRKSLEKMKFYDTNFKVFGICVLLLISTNIYIFIPASSIGDLNFLFAIILIIPSLIINLGMFYHQFKSKSYGWFSISLILFFIKLAPFSLMLFYFVKMRKEFQKGNGVYS